MLKKQYCSNYTYFFWLFIILHTLFWTMGPALARSTLPHDSLEGITWGLQWQFGYAKHPFLTAWLCAGITQLFGGALGWPVYLLAQLAVSFTFIAVWQLAKHFFPPKEALISALLLEGILFYNINSFNITPDTMQSPLWALLSLFLYKALAKQKILDWIITGLIAALCFCTKYQIVILLAPMFLLCCWDETARISFKKPGLYWSVIIFVIGISPNLVWLYQHDFISFIYAENTGAEYTQNKVWWNHFTQPLNFLVNGLIDIFGLLLLLWPFYRKDQVPLDLIKTKIQDLKTPNLTKFQKHFLFFIGAGPFFISLILCFLSGDYFPPRWGTPYFFCLGIISVALLNPIVSKRNMNLFFLSLVFLSSLLFGVRMLTLTGFPRVESDAFLPNKQIAEAVYSVWEKRYHKPLPYLAGSSYLVALTIPYMPTKPIPYFNWNLKENAWVDEASLYRKGAVFIWDEGHNFIWDQASGLNAELSLSVKQRFPKLEILPNIKFYRSSDQELIIVGVGILPPSP